VCVQFNLTQGDFLEDRFLSKIEEADVIFVNNFAFGADLNQALKVSESCVNGLQFCFQHFLLLR